MKRPSLEEVVEEVRSLDCEEEEEDEVATVLVAIGSPGTGEPQERQKRLSSGRSREHLRHFVVCIATNLSEARGIDY